jgi:signal transduction histidine kinase
LNRRARPLKAVALAFGTFAALDIGLAIANLEPMVLYSGGAVLVLVYSLFRWGSGRDIVVGFAVIVIGFAASVLTDYTGLTDMIGGAAVLLFAAALGLAVRYRSAAREQLIERAKLTERELLARELHDTVAHHVSAIAIQAQAGLVLLRSGSPEGATDALEIIDGEATQTLAEMRTMVGALRDRREQPEVAASDGLADLERLAADSSDSLRVGLELRGDLGQLSPAVEAALFRIAQESVTNARRHARQATRIEIDVSGSATDIQMTVSDNGARTDPTRRSIGYGLVGMTERASLLGGTLTAGPKPVRGWSVQAILPRNGTAL